MNHFLNVMAYSVLLIILMWSGKRALKAVGVYRLSRTVASNPEPHVCGDPKCPATVLISAIEDTHRQVRIEACWAVLTLLVPLAATTYAFGLLMSRLA